MASLFFGFLPAGLSSLFGPLLTFGGRHRFHTALPADLTALAAHLGHYLGQSIAVYRLTFGGSGLYDVKCDLIRIGGMFANTLWHTRMMPQRR
jgi:hypothetical protein